MVEDSLFACSSFILKHSFLLKVESKFFFYLKKKKAQNLTILINNHIVGLQLSDKHVSLLNLIYIYISKPCKVLEIESYM